MTTLRYTKNILDGKLQGCQLRASTKLDNAVDAVEWAMMLADGIQHDSILRAGFTAHNFSFESELGHDLGECLLDECQFCAEAAADAAFDLREDN